MIRFFSTILFALFTFPVYSQSLGSLEGKILGNDSLPVKSVTVNILNTELSGISNQDGVFKIKAVLPGKYQLEISSIGFTQQVLPVEIQAGITTEITVYLYQSQKYLDEVIVTVEKIEERVQRIPIAVSAFSSRKISEFRLWNLQDITALVPNLYSANPGDNRNATSIRGIGTTSYDPAVTTYVDGVNQFNLDTYIPQLMDVERIEVLRGPQGTLYGRNAMGGVINVITKKPVNRTEGFVELNVGNYGLQRYNGGFRTPVINGKLYFGAAVQYQSRKGYYENLYTGKDFDSQNVFTGNYYLKYLLSAKWSITANIKHVNNRNEGAFPLAPDKATAFSEPYTVNQNAIARMQDDALNASISVNHYSKLFQFSSQTAYQSNFRIYDHPLDGDFSPLDIITIFNNYGNTFNKVKVWTEEFKFTSPASQEGRLKWTLGSLLFLQNNPVKQATGFGSQAPLIGIPDSNFSIINSNEGKNSGFSIFGQANYMLTKKLTMTVGLRYDYEYKKLGIKSEYQQGPNPPFTILPDTAAENNYNAFSPKFAFSYSFNENQLVYLSYSRGFRTGGITPLASDPSQPPLFSYDPEYSDNFEVGWKNTWWKNRLRANLTAFLTRVSQAQVPTLILPDAITVIQNAGTLMSKGFEFEMEARLFKGLELQYNFGYTDATYTHLRLSQNGQESNLDGNKQIFTPSSTSMLAAQYSIPVKIKKPLQIVLRGEWLHLGKQYFDLANTIDQESYSLLNAKIGVMLKRFDVFFWGRNLGQQKYIAFAYDFGGVHLGDPRTYGITVAARF